MVLDSSAILAILLGEPEAEQFASAIEADPRRLVSAVSVVEAGIVIEVRKGPAGGRELDLLLHRGRIDIISFTEEQAEVARGAWRRYGRGNHPAALNFGDCCAYALSMTSREPLLFKGRDFSLTDIASVL